MRPIDTDAIDTHVPDTPNVFLGHKNLRLVVETPRLVIKPCTSVQTTNHRQLTVAAFSTGGRRVKHDVTKTKKDDKVRSGKIERKCRTEPSLKISAANRGIVWSCFITQPRRSLSWNLPERGSLRTLVDYLKEHSDDEEIS
ncbi:uncharacterized protein LOC144441052 [Glandiceps talaboti]